MFIILALVLLHCPVVFAEETPPQTPTRTPSFTKEGSETCLRCHSGEQMRAVLASPHGDLDIPGTPAATHGCESCHGKGSIHSSRAHGGKGFPALTEFGRGRRGSPREEKLQACLSCHAEESMGDKQTLFIGSTHDRSTINCSNCHQVHMVIDPMRDREAQTKACSRCHRGDIRRHVPVGGKDVDFDSQSCSECHDVHLPNNETREAED